MTVMEHTMSATDARLPIEAELRPRDDARRTLLVAGIAHALHDGFTDLIYVLLPVWQAEFGLGYGMLALLRGVYAGAMAGLQIPAGRLARRLGGRMVLAAGTALAALGYVLAGFSGGLAGPLRRPRAVGRRVEHAAPDRLGRGVARLWRRGARAARHLQFHRRPGKGGDPRGDRAAADAHAVAARALVAGRRSGSGRGGDRVAAACGWPGAAGGTVETRGRRGHGGFPLLFAIGVLDTGVRMGLLTFLPFLLKAKGAGLPTVGLALALVFIGGAAGKFACGWLGGRVGVLGTVLLTEGGNGCRHPRGAGAAACSRAGAAAAAGGAC